MTSAWMMEDGGLSDPEDELHEPEPIEDEPCPDCGVTVTEPTEPGLVHGCPCARVAWFYGDGEPMLGPPVDFFGRELRQRMGDPEFRAEYFRMRARFENGPVDNTGD